MIITEIRMKVAARNAFTVQIVQQTKPVLEINVLTLVPAYVE